MIRTVLREQKLPTWGFTYFCISTDAYCVVEPPMVLVCLLFFGVVEKRNGGLPAAVQCRCAQVAPSPLPETSQNDRHRCLCGGQLVLFPFDTPTPLDITPHLSLCGGCEFGLPAMLQVGDLQRHVCELSGFLPTFLPTPVADSLSTPCDFVDACSGCKPSTWFVLAFFCTVPRIRSHAPDEREHRAASDPSHHRLGVLHLQPQLLSLQLILAGLTWTFEPRPIRCSGPAL